MERKVYNKLVRDRIPEIIGKNGHNFKAHVAKDKEYELKLKEKLLEEFNEFVENPSAEELADILEVLDHIRKFHNIELGKVKMIKEEKFNDRGGFNKKIVLEWTKEK